MEEEIIMLKVTFVVGMSILAIFVGAIVCVALI